MLACSTISPPSVLSQTVPPTTPNPPRLTVIQGKVTNIQGNTVTVKTPDIPPPCEPGTPCILLIIVGPTFKVDISQAVFQSPNGSTVSKNLRVGDLIIVAGQQGPTLPPRETPPFPIRTLKAQVVEQDVP